MVFKPPNFDPGKKYPTVLFVYGGPAVQVRTAELKTVTTLVN
jgi:dipeptidyl aminopeptidase/acylaminoacyl peptidase